MHKRRRRSPSTKSTTHQSVEKQHALPDSIAKANREHRRGTRAARWSKRTCKPQRRKRVQATSFQLVSHFSSKVVLQLSVSGSRRLPLIVNSHSSSALSSFLCLA